MKASTISSSAKKKIGVGMALKSKLILTIVALASAGAMIAVGVMSTLSSFAVSITQSVDLDFSRMTNATMWAYRTGGVYGAVTEGYNYTTGENAVDFEKQIYSPTLGLIEENKTELEDEKVNLSQDRSSIIYRFHYALGSDATEDTKVDFSELTKVAGQKIASASNLGKYDGILKLTYRYSFGETEPTDWQNASALTDGTTLYVKGDESVYNHLWLYASLSLTDKAISKTGISITDFFWSFKLGVVNVDNLDSNTNPDPSKEDSHVTFYPNGGTLQGKLAGESLSQTILSGQTLTEPTISYTASDSEYTFAGWYAAPDFSGSAYTFGTELSAGTNLNLYAKWVNSVTFAIKDPTNANNYIQVKTVEVVRGQYLTSDQFPTKADLDAVLTANGIDTNKYYVIADTSGKVKLWNSTNVAEIPSETALIVRPVSFYTELGSNLNAVRFYVNYNGATQSILREVKVLFGSTVTETDADLLSILSGANLTSLRGDSKYIAKTVGTWNTKPDGTGEVFDITSTAVTAPINVYAQWSLVSPESIKIVYNWNDGVNGASIFNTVEGDTITGPTTPPQTAGILYGTKAGGTASQIVFYLEQSCTTTPYAYLSNGKLYKMDGTELTLSVEDLTTARTDNGIKVLDLYAYPKYLVKFVQNDGTDQANSASGEQYVNMNETATRPTDPTSEGLVFANWYQEATCENVFNFTTRISAPTTLYAGWTGAEHTITYQDEGGATYSGMTNTQGVPLDEFGFEIASKFVYKRGGADTIIKNGAKEGSEFLGWFTDSACTNELGKNADGAYIIGATQFNANLTLYAKWKNPIKVTFDYNYEGAPNAYETTISLNKTINQSNILTSVLYPTREGYEFLGYTTTLGGTTYADFDVVLTEDTTYYAKWQQPQNAYAIAIISSIEDTHISGLSQGFVETELGKTFTRAGISATTVVTLPQLTNANFNLKGYATTKGATEVEYTAGQTVSGLSATGETVTLYAIWGALVDFETDLTDVTIASQEVHIGGKATQPNESLTRLGYTFLHWSLTENGTDAFDFNTTIEQNTTLYAVWQENTYTIVLNPNGKSGATLGSLDGQTYPTYGFNTSTFKLENVKYSETFNLAELLLSNYEIYLYSLKSTWQAGDNKFEANQEVAVADLFTAEPTDGTLTLYAIWGVRVEVFYNYQQFSASNQNLRAFTLILIEGTSVNDAIYNDYFKYRVVDGDQLEAEFIRDANYPLVLRTGTDAKYLPKLAGAKYLGWFKDNKATTAFNADEKISASTKVYAGYEALENKLIIDGVEHIFKISDSTALSMNITDAKANFVGYVYSLVHTTGGADTTIEDGYKISLDFKASNYYVAETAVTINLTSKYLTFNFGDTVLDYPTDFSPATSGVSLAGAILSADGLVSLPTDVYVTISGIRYKINAWGASKTATTALSSVLKFEDVCEKYSVVYAFGAKADDYVYNIIFNFGDGTANYTINLSEADGLTIAEALAGLGHNGGTMYRILLATGAYGTANTSNQLSSIKWFLDKTLLDARVLNTTIKMSLENRESILAAFGSNATISGTNVTINVYAKNQVLVKFVHTENNCTHISGEEKSEELWITKGELFERLADITSTSQVYYGNKQVNYEVGLTFIGWTDTDGNLVTSTDVPTTVWTKWETVEKIDEQVMHALVYHYNFPDLYKQKYGLGDEIATDASPEERLLIAGSTKTSFYSFTQNILGYNVYTENNAVVWYTSPNCLDSEKVTADTVFGTAGTDGGETHLYCKWVPILTEKASLQAQFNFASLLGAGTDYVFNLSTHEQLIYLSYLINSGLSYSRDAVSMLYAKANYKITSAINLEETYKFYEYLTGSGFNAQEIQMAFSPIGTNGFEGTFDGGNFTITLNITTNAVNTLTGTTTTDNIGLFAKLNNATITNVTLAGKVVGSTMSRIKVTVGALAGYAENSTLSNINSSANVTADFGFVGGIVGEMLLTKANVALTGLTSTSISVTNNGAKSYGTCSTGGVIGLLNNQSANTISGWTNNSSVIGSGNVGGIIGNLQSSAGLTISSTTNAGRISSNSVDGGAGIGGIIGSLNLASSGSAKTIEIKDNSNTGYIGSNQDNYVGGTIGYMYGENSAKLTLNIHGNMGSGTVLGIKNVGGILGGIVFASTSADEINIYENASDAKLTGGTGSSTQNPTNLGGVIGGIELTGNITASIIANAFTGTITELTANALTNVGGIIGAVTAGAGASTVDITKNVSSSIFSGFTFASAGSILGRGIIASANASVTMTLNLTDNLGDLNLSVYSGGAVSEVGGVVGSLDLPNGATISLLRCVSTGKVVDNAKTMSTYGGIIGGIRITETQTAKNLSITDCYSSARLNTTIANNTTINGIYGKFLNQADTKALGDIANYANNSYLKQTIFGTNLQTLPLGAEFNEMQFASTVANLAQTNNYYKGQGFKVTANWNAYGSDATEENTLYYPIPKALTSHNSTEKTAYPIYIGDIYSKKIFDEHKANLQTKSGDTYSDATTYDITTTYYLKAGTGYSELLSVLAKNGSVEQSSVNQIEVDNQARLKLMSLAVNKTKYFATMSYLQTADITLEGETEYKPIGAEPSTTDYAFSGSYDGANHVVNFTRDNSAYTAGSYFGLFGYTYGADISNLAVHGVFYLTDTAQNVGAIVGYAKDTDLSNCIANVYMGNGTTATTKNVGGLVGTFEDTDEDLMENSITSSANVETIYVNATNVGGLVGLVITRANDMDEYDRLTRISRCFNVGQVGTKSASKVGGLVGREELNAYNSSNNYVYSAIKDCYSAGNINTADTTILSGTVGERQLPTSLSGYTVVSDNDGSMSYYTLRGTYGTNGSGKFMFPEVANNEISALKINALQSKFGNLCTSSSSSGNSLALTNHLPNLTNFGADSLIGRYEYTEDEYEDENGNIIPGDYTGEFSEDYLSGFMSRSLYAQQILAGDGSGNWYNLMTTTNDWNYFAFYNSFVTNVQLDDNIDLASATYKTKSEFNNILYGAGYSLNGMAVNANSSSKGGLFNKSSKGFTLKNVSVSGELTTSGAYNYIGGIVGDTSGDVEFINCDIHLTIIVSGGNPTAVGGLIGRAQSAKTVRVKDSTVQADISVASASAVGGVVGNANSVTYVRMDSVEINTTINATGSLTGAGGVVGKASLANGGTGASELYLSNSGSTGSIFTTNITAANTATNVGGLGGDIEEFYTGTYGNQVITNIKADELQSVGGVAGKGADLYCYYTTADSIVISGQITGNYGSKIGGLYGEKTGQIVGNVVGITSATNITVGQSSRTVSEVGGLFGSLSLTTKATIETPNVTGRITINAGTANYIGGLIGSYTSTLTTLTISYKNAGSQIVYMPINLNSETVVSGIGGLVGYVYGYITIQDINAISVSPEYKKKSDYIGGLVGKMTSASTITINNVKTYGTITFSYGSCIGGMVGGGETGSVYITNSLNYIKLKTNTALGAIDKVGGLVGQASAFGTNNSTTIKNTSSTPTRNFGTIDITSMYPISNVGGVVGQVNILGSSSYGIEYLHNLGDITVTKNSSSSNENTITNVGGVAGYVALYTDMNDVYNIGRVTAYADSAVLGNNNSSAVGGLIGKLVIGSSGYGTVSNIEFSANYGDISGGTEVGGLIGKLDRTNTSYKLEIYSIAVVGSIKSTITTATGGYAGGLIGYLTAAANSSSNRFACFYTAVTIQTMKYYQLASNITLNSDADLQKFALNAMYGGAENNAQPAITIYDVYAIDTVSTSNKYGHVYLNNNGTIGVTAVGIAAEQFKEDLFTNGDDGLYPPSDPNDTEAHGWIYSTGSDGRLSALPKLKHQPAEVTDGINIPSVNPVDPSSIVYFEYYGYINGEKYYIVETQTELRNLAKVVNEGLYDSYGVLYAECNYLIHGGTANTGTISDPSGITITSGFTPIGTKNRPFKGKILGGYDDEGSDPFDITEGKAEVYKTSDDMIFDDYGSDSNYTGLSYIQNLKISSTEQYVGLFGYAQGATFENLNLTGTISVTSNANNTLHKDVYVGAMVGLAENCSFKNCQITSTSGTVTYNASSNSAGTGTVGGYFGKMLNCQYITGSMTNRLNITGAASMAYAGGIAGSVEFTTGTNRTIGVTALGTLMNYGNIDFEGSLSKKTIAYGGIFGQVSATTSSSSNMTVTFNYNMTNHGKVGSVLSPFAVRDDGAGGGIIGRLGTNGNFATYNLNGVCFNASDSLVSRYYSGGLIGKFEGGALYINNKVTNYGSIQGTAKAGGIIGYMASSYAKINVNQDKGLLFNNGNIMGIDAAGGIIGYAFSANSTYYYNYLYNCFNDGYIHTNNTVTGDMAGGIIAQIWGGSTFVLQNCANEGSIMAKSNVGGLVGGYSRGSYQGTVSATKCYNSGALKGYNTSADVAGLVNTTLTIKIQTSYVAGETNHAFTRGTLTSDSTNVYILNTAYNNNYGLSSREDFFAKTLTVTELAKNTKSLSGFSTYTTPIGTNNIAYLPRLTALANLNAYTSTTDYPTLTLFSTTTDNSETVYAIKSYKDLLTMSAVVNDGISPYISAKYKQTVNIYNPLSLHLVPIGGSASSSGTTSVENKFCGIYNGSGYKIYGLQLYATGTYWGMFGQVGSGASLTSIYLGDQDTTTKLTVEGNQESRIYGAGVLAGLFKGSVMSNCRNYYDVLVLYDKSISTSSMMVNQGIVGGLVGFVSHDDTNNVVSLGLVMNYGNITVIPASADVGGLFGFVSGGGDKDNTKLSINGDNYGDIIARNSDTVGGLIGSISNGADITGLSTCGVAETLSNGTKREIIVTINGAKYVGGLMGRASNIYIPTKSNIARVYANITATASDGYAGGIFGGVWTSNIPLGNVVYWPIPFAPILEYPFNVVKGTTITGKHTSEYAGYRNLDA